MKKRKLIVAFLGVLSLAVIVAFVVPQVLEQQEQNALTRLIRSHTEFAATKSNERRNELREQYRPDIELLLHRLHDCNGLHGQDVSEEVEAWMHAYGCTYRETLKNAGIYSGIY